MESSMNRKQRVTDPYQMRNGIPTASLGDKYYKDATREPGFCKQEGLVTGSTIGIRKSAKPQFKKSESLTSQVKTKSKMTMTFSEKKAKASLDYDKQEVLALNKPGEKLGQVVPSWEERTGFWLCRPEDEAD
jgi:hypothetical protein